MCMVYDDKGNVLVQDKIDENWGGLTFPGGHVEKGESFVALYFGQRNHHKRSLFTQTILWMYYLSSYNDY